MNAFVSTATSQVTSREIVLKFLIVQSAEQEDTHWTDAPANHRGTGTHAKLENPEINKKETKISHNCTTTQQWQAPTTNSPASGTGTSIHQNAPNTSHSSPHSNAQSPASGQHSQSTLHVRQPLTLTLHNFNLTYT